MPTFLFRQALNLLCMTKWRQNLPIELADEGAKIAVKNKCDIIIGIGGGSAMDVAKAIAVIATNKGMAADYLGLNKFPNRDSPK